MKKLRNLILILGDQLSEELDVLKDVDKKNDLIVMAEVLHESTKVSSHKMRTVVFLSAMRHFAEKLKEKKYQLIYLSLSDQKKFKSFNEAISFVLTNYSFQKILVTEPGEYDVFEEVRKIAKTFKLTLEIKNDNTFLSNKRDFSAYAEGKKQIRMEFFYREMRKKYSILMDGKDPEGGEWNYDQENRKSFKKEGPGKVPFLDLKKDSITEEVLTLVNDLFKDNPGSTEEFNWPVTHTEAKKLLDFFIKNLLPHFGDWQDAMWTNEAFLYHSRLSVALNLKLLTPMEVIKAAEQSYKKGHVSLASAEGFIRQILGWREYVRGVYFHFMPEYISRNFLKADEDLPPLYWNAKTEMNCMRDVVTQTMNFGYAHHIQRLMVTGLFSLLYGVRPTDIHQWYLAVYVDAVEWVELPNTLGMSQYGDGGVMASKPYIASGKYISRMSNYCKGCKYSPEESTGPNACPFTTFYWDFIRKHQALISKNPRLAMQVKNWQKLGSDKQKEIELTAKNLRKNIKRGNI